MRHLQDRRRPSCLILCGSAAREPRALPAMLGPSGTSLSPPIGRSEAMKLNATSKIIAVAALVAIVIYCALPAGRVRALPMCGTGCVNLRFTFGMLGITTGQTARLNVVNALPQPPSTRVTLMFVDANGNPVNIAGAPLQTTVTLSPGQS